jgi:hypothetical protein
LAVVYSSPAIGVSLGIFLIGHDASSLEITLFIIVTTILLGLVPATLLGMITGGLIGVSVRKPSAQSNRWSIGLRSLAISAMIALVLNLTIGRAISNSSLTYWLFMGIPSLVYVLGGTWLGLQILGQVAEPTNNNASALQASHSTRLDMPMLAAGGSFILIGLVTFIDLSNSPVSAQANCFSLTGYCTSVVTWIAIAVVAGIAVLFIYGSTFRITRAKAEAQLG